MNLKKIKFLILVKMVSKSHIIKAAEIEEKLGNLRFEEVFKVLYNSTIEVVEDLKSKHKITPEKKNPFEEQYTSENPDSIIYNRLLDIFEKVEVTKSVLIVGFMYFDQVAVDNKSFVSKNTLEK